VYLVRSSDVLPRAALANPVAPDVILGVPPPVLLGRAKKAEPEIDHPALATKSEIPGLEELIRIVESHLCLAPPNGPPFSCGRSRRLPCRAQEEAGRLAQPATFLGG
jgi:hypothetical protein